MRRRTIRATATTRAGHPTTRTLHPLGLVAKAGTWYLVADGGNGPRTYRVARLADIVITDDAFDLPRGFDLARYWQAHTDEIEELRSGVAATLRVRHWVVPILREQFGRSCAVLDREGEHTVVTVRVHLLVGLAEQLAGWGNRIDVLAPPELRAELCRIGGDLVAHHGRGGDGEG